MACRTSDPGYLVVVLKDEGVVYWREMFDHISEALVMIERCVRFLGVEWRGASVTLVCPHCIKRLHDAECRECGILFPIPWSEIAGVYEERAKGVQS
jgi:hypothetical protein